jgi:hypothetical protein
VPRFFLTAEHIEQETFMVSRILTSPTLMILILMSACSRRVEESRERSPSSLATQSAALATAAGTLARSDGGLAIGDPCVRDDGWRPPQVGSVSVVGSTKPVVHLASDLAAIGWKDFHQLASGIGYCLPPGGVYPSGYFTMNCSVDSDCPGSAFCDSGHCWRECFHDSDCGSGMSCSGTPKAFCQGTLPPTWAGR